MWSHYSPSTRATSLPARSRHPPSFSRKIRSRGSIDDSNAEVTITERGVVVRYSGPVTLGDVQQAVASMTGHPDFQPHLPTVWDFSEAAPTEGLGADEMKKLASVVGPIREGAGRPRVAIVVSGGSSFGGARMFGAVGGPRLHAELGIFKELGSAESWAFDAQQSQEKGPNSSPSPSSVDPSTPGS